MTNQTPSKATASLFLIFTLSVVFSVYALLTPDFLRISKDPIFQLFSQEFGLFKTCITQGSSTSCMQFPNEKCQIRFDGNFQNLSFCQSWLAARYLQIGAILFGSLAWFGWLGHLILNKSITALVIFWCSGLHALFQILVMQLMTSLREDNIFYLGGAYGNSFSALNASWGLSIGVIVMFAVTLLIKRQSVVYVYVPIP
ncbi:hypothetical protein BC833DRAFT_607565 [Globomyces pollinis-pini]|nr:hypothetical protein BC833DRAFT_607565 [Globomyces pollinis-pini]